MTPSVWPCALRAQCTRSRHGRTLCRHREQELVDRAVAQGLSAAAHRSRRRRRHLMEGSFAQAANRHHFKRSRWCRLWRQQIQDWLIAACQNIKLLLRATPVRPAGAGTPPNYPDSSPNAPSQPALGHRFANLRLALLRPVFGEPQLN